MNWAQFQDTVSHMCLAGAVVASRPLTQEVAGSSSFIVMRNIFVTEFSQNIKEKLHFMINPNITVNITSLMCISLS